VEQSGVKGITETKEFGELYDYIKQALRENRLYKSANFTKKTLKVIVHCFSELKERIAFKTSMLK